MYISNSILFFILFVTIVLFEIYTCFEINTIWCIVSSVLSIVCIMLACFWMTYIIRNINNLSNPTGSVILSFSLLGGVYILSIGLLVGYLYFFRKQHSTPSSKITTSSLFVSCFAMVLITSIGMYFYFPRYFRYSSLLFTLFIFPSIYFIMKKEFETAFYIVASVLILIILSMTIYLCIVTLTIYGGGTQTWKPFPVCTKRKQRQFIQKNIPQSTDDD